jgi:hypothetical protein
LVLLIAGPQEALAIALVKLRTATNQKLNMMK